MLKKLIKYDFIAVNKDLILLYIPCIVLSCIVLLCGNNPNDTLVATKKICTDLSLVGMMLIIIIPFIRVLLRIRNTLFKEESYLYLSIPVKRSKLYDSKLIVSLLSLLISWLILGLCFINVFSGKNVFTFITLLLDNYTGIENNIIFILTLAVQMSLIFMSLAVGLLLGNKIDYAKDILSFVFGIVVYAIIRLLIGYFYELDNNIISIVIVVIWDIILFFIGRNIYSKGMVYNNCKNG